MYFLKKRGIGELKNGYIGQWTLCIGFSYNMYNLCTHINIYSIKILLVKNVTSKSNIAVTNNSIKLLNANAQIY